MIYRKFYFIITAGLFLSFNNSSNTNETPPFYEGTVNTKLYRTNLDKNKDIYLSIDTLENPLFYYSDIISPVCIDNVCKPAQLRLFWDVCGNFLGFKIPENAPLTKKNHNNFTNYDYHTLYVILNNPKAEIGKMSKSDLINYNAVDDVDAITGATSTGAEHWVVEGAAYSTHTLWYMVNDTRGFILPKTPKENRSKDYWLLKFERTESLTTTKLTLLLFEAEQNKMLRKYSIQKLLVANINKLSALNALLINNYLHRQPFLPSDIENALLMCKSVQGAFNRMLPLSH
jgi:hypothetical protein